MKCLGEGALAPISLKCFLSLRKKKERSYNWIVEKVRYKLGPVEDKQDQCFILPEY